MVIFPGLNKRSRNNDQFWGIRIKDIPKYLKIGPYFVFNGKTASEMVVAIHRQDFIQLLLLFQFNLTNIYMIKKPDTEPTEFTLNQPADSAFSIRH